MSQMSVYDPSVCASQCDSVSSCKGFTIYYERDPIVQPAAACADPNAQTSVRCAYYSSAVDSKYATNIGEWRSSFAVVIAGANGYSKKAVTTAPVAATTSTSAAASAATTAAASTNPFTILSAYFADSDITTQARANFLVNGQLIVNTTFPGTSLGSTDPWSGNSAKSITILYTYKNETRVFAALQNSGAYTQQAASFSTATAPGSALVPGYTAPTGSAISIAAVVWGPTELTTQSIFTALYSAYSSKSGFAISDDNFGVDTAWGVVKSAVVWYYDAAGALKALVGREDATVYFS